MMKKFMESCTILLFCFSLFFIFSMSTATDTITMAQSIRDGQTIVSAGGTFELGFFSTAKNSTKRYVGIWFKKVSNNTIVWVANRKAPITDSSGVLKVTNQGILLLNGNNTTIWSTSNSSNLGLKPIAQLLDTGNFVIRDENDNNPENFLWQSFNYPTDTFLAGMKVGKNNNSQQAPFFSSWRSSDDPSPGDFTYRVDPTGFPELILWKGSAEQFRLGAWDNGLRYIGNPNLRPNPIYRFHFVYNQNEAYYTYELLNSSVITRLVVNGSGSLQRFVWIERTQQWQLFLTVQTDACDTYALCGANGICNIGNSPACGCLEGFVPKFPSDWAVADWSNGCVRRVAMDCPTDGFIKLSGVKLPETRYAWFNYSMTLEECRIKCLMNCSCMAYANLEVTQSGRGCLLWSRDLIDIRVFIENGGLEIYIRMAFSELEQLDNTKTNVKKRAKIIVISVLTIGVLLLSLALIFYLWRKKHSRAGKLGPNQEIAYSNEGEDLELPLFDMATLAKATSNFSFNNKLGEGGFGPVYHGVLEDGQEIAVKRLSKNSGQGLNEFKNEVVHISKLQHRNLVKLLGCCIQTDEKMLIYEFMPNKSLDSFIFGHARNIQLDWSKRFHIINGIAQGLLYLHRDSRWRIIHRDLKASNILLDEEMNPKISDFGLSRSFGGNETKTNTSKVVGTYGYMSPEYAIDGFYSVKSDVFSFGVLLLEIVSGKRNRGFFHPDHQLNLLGHAWRLYIDGRPLELIDSSIGETHNLSEVLRSIHVGLLCVQRCPEDRPSISYVVTMLCSEDTLPQPKEPGFFNERNLVEEDSSSSKIDSCSGNQITITLLGGR